MALLLSVVHVGVFALCFRYSFKRRRPFYFDIIAAVAANVFTLAFGHFVFYMPITEYILYYIFVTVFESILCVLIRAFFTLSEEDEKMQTT